MGAINFSLDKNLVKLIVENTPVETLVETGTYKGDTPAEFNDVFKDIYTVEIDKDLYALANKRLEIYKNITVEHAEASEFLEKYHNRFKEKPTLFWLDAHWCKNSYQEKSFHQCSILKELDKLSGINASSFILIDDARYFLTRPSSAHRIDDWPYFQELINKFNAISNNHAIQVVNDVIIFYPVQYKEIIDQYSREYSVDLHDLVESTNLDVLSCMKEKENQIEKLSHEVALLREENKFINMGYLAGGTSQRLLRNTILVFLRIISIIAYQISPKIGILEQHPPKPLKIGKVLGHESDKDLPTCSIVTPSYNHGKYIEKTIESVLLQNVNGLQYIIQDNMSKDETESILKRYENLASIYIEKDSGQANAINKGFSKSYGDIMGWINSDDILMPGALKYILNFFKNNPDVDVVYGDRLIIDSNGKQIGRWILPKHRNYILSWSDFVPQETLFWRRSIWEKIGQIDEEFKYALDWDLLCRFREKGAKIRHLPEVLGGFRVHSEQITSTAYKSVGLKEMNLIRQRELGYEPSVRMIRLNLTLYMAQHLLSDKIYVLKEKINKLRRQLKMKLHYVENGTE